MRLNPSGSHRFAAAATVPGALLLVLLAAPPVSGQDYYSDVRPLLVENCMGCHTDAGIAWSMEDPDEAFRMRHAIANAVLERRMPPWLAEPGHQAYHDDPSLGPEVLAVIRAWRDAGFELGQPSPDPAPPADAHAHVGFQPDLSVEILPSEAYLPNQDRSDDYRCFVVPWPKSDAGYVTGFRAVPGNLLVAHHVVVHAVAPEMADRFAELADEEEGAGYQCFGGAVPDRLGQRAEREAYEARYPDGIRELSLSSFWLAHWAPGMDGHRFPEGTGMLLEPGSVLVVQMHYYAREAPGERDAGSRLDFQVASEVERPALHLPQTRNAWLSGEQNGSMVIAPGETATYELVDVLGDLVPFFGRVAQVDPERIQGVEIHSVNLHMHAFGHSGEVALTDRNGRHQTLLSVPRWDLSWQRDFTFVEPKVFSRDELPATRLAVRCTFRNTRDETVYGGFGSFDEMCFNFSYIALRVGDEVASPEADHDRLQEAQRDRPQEPENDRPQDPDRP